MANPQHPVAPEPTCWTIHGERLVDDTRRLRLSIVQVELPDGVHFEQYVVRMPEAAITVLLDDARERVLMIWRHRFVPDRWTWELPGGYVDADEDPAITAAREVEEETGPHISGDTQRGQAGLAGFLDLALISQYRGEQRQVEQPTPLVADEHVQRTSGELLGLSWTPQVTEAAPELPSQVGIIKVTKPFRAIPALRSRKSLLGLAPGSQAHHPPTRTHRLAVQLRTVAQHHIRYRHNTRYGVDDLALAMAAIRLAVRKSDDAQERLPVARDVVALAPVARPARAT
ncbi:MAG: NUDIX hydrolase [Pseudonocardiaceae bacterium]